MPKLLYHRGTGTYFAMDDDVYVIDTDLAANPIDSSLRPEIIDDDLMDAEGEEVAIYWGERLIDVTTEKQVRPS